MRIIDAINIAEQIQAKYTHVDHESALRFIEKLATEEERCYGMRLLNLFIEVDSSRVSQICQEMKDERINNEACSNIELSSRSNSPAYSG